MYYYTDMLRYLLVYQDIDSNNENADIMSEENADNMNNDNIMKTQLKEENIQKSDDNERFETVTEY